MDATLHALGGILLKAVPTFVLVVLLYFYLKHMFFRPLEKVLQERFDATEGARRRAEESLQRAAAKAAEYEEAMRSARAEVYQEQERLHRELDAERQAEIAGARSRAEAMVREARQSIEEDVAHAKVSLEAESGRLAEEIASGVLGRRLA